MRHTRLMPCLAGICVGRQRLGSKGGSPQPHRHPSPPLPRSNAPCYGAGCSTCFPCVAPAGTTSRICKAAAFMLVGLWGKRVQVQFVRKEGVHWLISCRAVLRAAVDGARPRAV